MLAWILLNPKTTASIFLGLLLIGGLIFAVHHWDGVELAQKQNAIDAQAHQIDTLNRNADVLKSANDASAKALADLQAAQAAADAAAQASQAKLDAQTARNDQLTTELKNAPAADKACFPIALGRLFDGVYAADSTSSSGQHSGPGSDQSKGPAGVLRQAAPVAGGNPLAVKPVITVSPSH